MRSGKPGAGWLPGLHDARLIVWGIVLGAALVLVAVLLLLQQATQQERESAFHSAQENNSRTVLSDEVRLRSLLATLDKVMLVVRKDFADNPKLTQQQLLDRLAVLKLDTKLDPRFFILDASGNMLHLSARSVDARPFKKNFADRDYFQAQKTDLSDLLRVGAPFLSRITGGWSIPLTRRITRQDGSFGGIIGVAVDPGLFTEPFVQAGAALEQSRSIIGLDGYTRVRLVRGRIEYVSDVHTSQVFQEIKKSKVGSYTAIAAIDGIRRLTSYRVIDPYGIIVVAGTAVADIEASYAPGVRNFVRVASLISALTVLLSGLLIFGLQRHWKLTQSRQSFNRLIELVPQSIFRMDARGTIFWANRRTIDYAGPSVDEQARGFGWVLATVHPGDRVRAKAFITSALQLGTGTETCEYRQRRLDGAYRWFSSQATRVTGAHEADDFFLFTATDIHDHKMAAERAQVAQKLESIGQLTSGMAHDFNNLLAIVAGNLDLLVPHVKDDAGARRLGVAISAVERGIVLVKSLLAIASKQPLLPARIDLWNLMERTSPLLRHALGQRVNFVLQPPPGEPVHVEVDETGLEAALLNLIVNARDAMPQGGDLTLGLDITSGMACILVRDTGTGMPAAVLRRATEPFFTTKENGRGTGLGLSMVAGFAKQSDGILKIDSEEGQGTTITLALPLAPATPTLTASIAAPQMQATSGRKRRVLIVDDEHALAELVQAWVVAEGHTAVLAHCADDALALLAVTSFDFLLTDIIMPGQRDGLGLAEEAAALQPAIKILLMSGYSSETATNRADVPWPLLVKPFRKEELDAAMARA